MGVRHPRPPACRRTLGRLDAEILWHGPPPAFARGQGAAGGAEASMAAIGPRRRAGGALSGGRPASSRRLGTFRTGFEGNSLPSLTLV